MAPVIIKNLCQTVERGELREVIEEHVRIKSIKIEIDNEISSKFAIVELYSAADEELIVERLNESTFKGRILQVKYLSNKRRESAVAVRPTLVEKLDNSVVGGDKDQIEKTVKNVKMHSSSEESTSYIEKSMEDVTLNENVDCQLIPIQKLSVNENIQEQANSSFLLQQPKQMKTLMSLQISYISYQIETVVTPEFCKELYDKYGNVDEVIIKKAVFDSTRNCQSGYGFVSYEYENDEELIAVTVAAVENVDSLDYKSVIFSSSASKYFDGYIKSSKNYKMPSMNNADFYERSRELKKTTAVSKVYDFSGFKENTGTESHQPAVNPMYHYKSSHRDYDVMAPMLQIDFESPLVNSVISEEHIKGLFNTFAPVSLVQIKYMSVSGGFQSGTA